MINHKFSLEKAFQEILNHLKRLKNIDLLSELLFNEELNIIKTNLAFTGYAMSYKVQLVEKKKIHLNSYKQANQELKTCLVIF